MKDDLSDFSPSRKGVERGSSRFRLSLPGLGWELFLVLLVFGVPKAQVIFADYGVNLPRATLLVIHSSHWVIAHASLLMVLLGATWIVSDALCRHLEAGLSRSWSVLGLAFPWLLIALMLTALGLPLLDLHYGLQG